MIEFIDNDDKIIDIISESKQIKNKILNSLDNELSAGLLICHIDYKKSKRACLICKFTLPGDSGLTLTISENDKLNSILPFIEIMLIGFKINMNIDEFINIHYPYMKN